MHKRKIWILSVIAMLLLSCLILLQTAVAENEPQIEWSNTFGGEKNDYCNSVTACSDGGYMIIGDTSSYNIGYDKDIWLIKTDSSGHELWNKTYGGNRTDEGISVQEIHDGGYIILGETSPEGFHNLDIILIRTDSNGVQQWQQTFGGSNYDNGNCVRQTEDNGFIIIGTTKSFRPPDSTYDYIWLIKTDSQGNEEWNKTLLGHWQNGGYSIKITSDQGFIIVGEHEFNVCILKTDSKGNIEWEKSYGGEPIDRGRDIVATIDGGYIVVGETNTYGNGKTDIWLIKIDSEGNKIWDKTFGGTYNDAGYSVVQLSDEGFLITGYTYLSDKTSDYDIWVIKTDSEGNREWDITFGEPEQYDVGNVVLQSEDGGYVIGGYIHQNGKEDTDAWITKIRSGQYSSDTGIDTKTPGFEFILIIVALFFITYMKRR